MINEGTQNPSRMAGIDCLRKAACRSPLTAPRSPLPVHRSPLPAHRSPAPRSPLTAHRSPLTTHRSPLTVNHLSGAKVRLLGMKLAS